MTQRKRRAHLYSTRELCSTHVPREEEEEDEEKNTAWLSHRHGHMHVDHTYDVQHICTTWKSLSTPSPPRWDYGVRASKLCHLLFGTTATDDEEACLSRSARGSSSRPERSEPSKTEGKIACFAPRGISTRLLA